MSFRTGFLGSAIAGIAGTVLSAIPGFAAEKITLKYSILRETIPVADLTMLAETGKAPDYLEHYIRLGKQEPQEVQKALNQQAKVSPIVLDRVLNSPVGNLVLDELGKTIHTPAGVADRQALRAALVISASKDSKISLIEVMQNYPTQEVVVEGDRIVAAARQLTRLEKGIGKVLGDIKLF
jgi:hypothetical protein